MCGRCPSPAAGGAGPGADHLVGAGKQANIRRHAPPPDVCGPQAYPPTPTADLQVASAPHQPAAISADPVQECEGPQCGARTVGGLCQACGKARPLQSWTCPMLECRVVSPCVRHWMPCRRCLRCGQTQQHVHWPVGPRTGATGQALTVPGNVLYPRPSPWRRLKAGRGMRSPTQWVPTKSFCCIRTGGATSSGHTTHRP